ncbi:hypothetical protein RFI_10809, partial [Reticulomyxa filosa]
MAQSSNTKTDVVSSMENGNKANRAKMLEELSMTMGENEADDDKNDLERDGSDNNERTEKRQSISLLSNVFETPTRPSTDAKTPSNPGIDTTSIYFKKKHRKGGSNKKVKSSDAVLGNRNKMSISIPNSPVERSKEKVGTQELEVAETNGKNSEDNSITKASQKLIENMRIKTPKGGSVKLVNGADESEQDQMQSLNCVCMHMYMYMYMYMYTYID